MIKLDQLQEELQSIIQEWEETETLEQGDLFVIGCSTSEVAGQEIGTSGSEEIAAEIFAAMEKLQQRTKVHLAFQCCEHLNRALVVEKSTMEKFSLEAVTVIPIRNAGGSMAAHAYQHMEEPVVVEKIQADAGMDIGETLIGMHLKPVAVPLRFKQRYLGDARINYAKTRPKLIGGERAVYRH